MNSEIGTLDIWKGQVLLELYGQQCTHPNCKAANHTNGQLVNRMASDTQRRCQTARCYYAYIMQSIYTTHGTLYIIRYIWIHISNYLSQFLVSVWLEEAAQLLRHPSLHSHIVSHTYTCHAHAYIYTNTYIWILTMPHASHICVRVRVWVYVSLSVEYKGGNEQRAQIHLCKGHASAMQVHTHIQKHIYTFCLAMFAF